MTFKQDKIAKNKQRGEADRHFKGHSGSGNTDMSISDPFTSSDRSDSRPDDRALSHGDIMKSKGGRW
jgi:hypothetical protein